MGISTGVPVLYSENTKKGRTQIRTRTCKKSDTKGMADGPKHFNKGLMADNVNLKSQGSMTMGPSAPFAFLAFVFAFVLSYYLCPFDQTRPPQI